MSHIDEGALHAYLDGELASTERKTLEAHVAECPACRARLAEERALVERASQLLGLAQPLERPAPPLHQLRQPRLMWRLRMPLAWAASIVLAVSLGYYLRDPRSEMVTQPASSTVATADDRATSAAAEEKAAAPRERRQLNQSNRLNDALTGGAVGKTSTDSHARHTTPTSPPAAGVVAARPPASLRNAEPVPAVVPNAAEPAARAEADLSMLRGRLVATEWPVISREPARRILGAEPVGVPGLPVRDIRRSPAGDGTVLVEQQLDATTVIQLFQRPATAERAAYTAPAPMRLDRSSGAREYAAADRLARFVGALRVEIAGPLSQDSLNRLLEQVKPLP